MNRESHNMEIALEADLSKTKRELEAIKAALKAVGISDLSADHCRTVSALDMAHRACKIIESCNEGNSAGTE